MSTKEQVLDILINSKEFISGEEIANKLNISRNSVWKAIKKLKEEGNEIDAVSNKGYLLVNTNNDINANNIRKFLNNKNLKIDIRESVTSTNIILKELAENNTEEGIILLAHEQTNGKGRKNRTFYSPKSTGIYMSILLRPTCPITEALFITTASAVAVANAVSELTVEVKIKWVNDVYLRDKKICGILTEASTDFETNSLKYVVLGIGLNVSVPKNGFDKEISNIAGAIFKEEVSKEIYCKLIASIINKFFDFYRDLESKSFMKDYREKSMLTGQSVDLLSNNIVEKGTVIGIDDEAKLIIKLEGGNIKKYSTGEVQIVK